MQILRYLLVLVLIAPLAYAAQTVDKLYLTDSKGIDATDTTNHAVRVINVAGGASFAILDGVGGVNKAQVNASNQLSVVCANCSGSGVSQIDNTGFTGGSTVFVPQGGVFNDALTTLTSGDAGAVRLTSPRAMHTNLRNNSGVEVGTGGNPLRIDPVGTTAQPVSGTVGISGTVTVSGTVTANQGGSPWAMRLQDGAAGTLATVTAGNAVKVDGSAVTQPVSGTVNPGNTANTTPWLVSVNQGGTTAQVETVAPLSTDAGIVVRNINPNLAQDNSTNSVNKVPVLAGRANAGAPTWTEGNQVPISTDLSGNVRITCISGCGSPADNATGSTALGALNAVITVPLTGEQGATFQLQASGTLNGQVTPQCSFDGGTLYNVNGYFIDPVSGQLTTVAPAAAGALPTATTNYPVLCPHGASHAQIKVTTYTSGTANWVARATASDIRKVLLGSVSTSAPTYTTGQLGTLSLTTAGAVRVDNSGVTQPVSGTITAQPGNTANTTPWLTSQTPATSGGTTPCYLTSAATTNATNCKASAGQLYGFDLVNTTTTIYYLRLYNLAAAPTCSSATGFVRTIPIPPASAAGGAGGITRDIANGEAYSTGLGFCLTGGGSSTDNTNAATGVYITLQYK